MVSSSFPHTFYSPGLWTLLMNTTTTCHFIFIRRLVYWDCTILFMYWFFFLEFNTLPSNNREPDFSNLSNCRVINEKIMHSNLKGTQVDVWIFMYPSTLESDDTALRLFLFNLWIFTVELHQIKNQQWTTKQTAATTAAAL